MVTSVAMLFCFSTFSQDSIPEKNKQLKVVPIVQGKDWRTHISDLTSASPRYILNSGKLEDLGATDVGEAMNFIPGIQLKNYGGVGGIKTVSYRSLGATHTAVNLNYNVLINNQIGTVNLSGLQTFGIYNVVFNSGQPKSSLAPASAFMPASSIRVLSKVGISDTATSLEVYQKVTSINDFESGLLAHFKLGEKAYVGVEGLTNYGSGRYKYQYNLTGSDQEFSRQNSEVFNYKLTLGYGYKINKNSSFFGTVDFYDNQQNLPGAVILFNPSNDQSLANNDWRANLHYANFKGKNGLHLHAFAAQNKTLYEDPTFLNLEGFLNADYKMRTTGAGYMLSRKFKFHSNKLFLGSDILFSDLESSQFENNPARLNVNSVVGCNFWVKKLRIEANLSHQFIYDQARSADTLNTKTYSRFSPYVSFSVLPFKDQKVRVRAFYKNAYRMPTFNDLYYNFIGNTNLLPENAHLSNLGISFETSDEVSGETFKEKSDFEINVDGFYNYVFNKIVAVPTKDLFNWSMQNIGETLIYGFDASATWTMRYNKWSAAVSTSHTFNNSIDKTDPNLASFDDQIPYIPLYSSSLSGLIAYRDYKLNANAFYNGGRYTLNENIPSNYLEGFIDINLGLQKKFKFKKYLGLNVNLKAMNILNKNYEVIRSFPMPGRYYQITLNFSYK